MLGARAASQYPSSHSLGPDITTFSHGPASDSQDRMGQQNTSAYDGQARYRICTIWDGPCTMYIRLYLDSAGWVELHGVLKALWNVCNQHVKPKSPRSLCIVNKIIYHWGFFTNYRSRTLPKPCNVEVDLSLSLSPRYIARKEIEPCI